MICTSTGATLYSLVYGDEAVLQDEVQIPTMRIIMEAELNDAEWVKIRHDQLCMLDEKRIAAIYHAQYYQKRIAKFFNKSVRPRKFKEGDLVFSELQNVFEPMSKPLGQ